MVKQLYIKNIEGIVRDKVNGLGLKPRLKLADFKAKGKRFYTTPCKAVGGETVLFKMLISKREEDTATFQNEVKVVNFLSQVAPQGLDILPFIKVEAKKYPYWYLRSFLPGPLLGYDFKIYKQGLKKEKIKKVLDKLFLLQSLPLDIKLKRKTANDYLKAIKSFENKLKLKDKNKEIDFEKIYRFFGRQKKYFRKENFVLSHGDFVLKNFFVNQNKVYIIDWELARIDNVASDIARMLIQPYRYPRWRKEALLYFLNKLPAQKKREFKQLFRITIMAEAIGEFSCNILTTPKENFLRKSMRQTIEASIKGFDSLIYQ